MVVTIRNIAKIMAREKITHLLLQELNNFTELPNTLQTVVAYIKGVTQVSAVAIRILNERSGRFPYYTYDGFSKDFIEKEDKLCRSLDCLCGCVLTGNTNANYEIFTPGGSFVSNDVERLDEVIPPEYKKYECGFPHFVGYNSATLIPIRNNGRIMGLIQLNDINKNKFDIDIITYLETIGIYIGTAIYNSEKFSKLQDDFNKLNSIAQSTIA